MRTTHVAHSLCLIVAVGWNASLCSAEHAVGGVWLHDFAKAEAEAKRLNRPLVVHFHTRKCPPCKRMEREVLETTQVLKLLGDGFVAVKVDLDPAAGNTWLQQKYRVESMPTDLVLSHDGKLLNRSEGYNGLKSGDGQKYISALTRIDTTYAKEGLRQSPLVAGEVKSTPTATSTKTAPKETEKGVANSSIGGKLVPEPHEPVLMTDNAAAAETSKSTTDTPRSVAANNTEPIIGLDGYCPVTLRATRTWKTGETRFACEYDGQTFFFLASDKLEEFKANPDRYVPRLLGCDAVVLAESNLVARGSTKFGAFYEGELFLFETSDSRARFRKDPPRYIHLKHALKPEDLRDTHKLASTAAQ
ncbi:MAG: DUF255 domain-containing protein [Planctomycetaceae bacterium]|nr:DUF255 domain-containing protein [Planctomycetaceae bacterium]